MSSFVMTVIAKLGIPASIQAPPSRGFLVQRFRMARLIP
jgi:hypothetical protein